MTITRDAFDGEQLLPIIRRLPAAGTIWVGFSGGADSTALLHALHELNHRLNTPLRAIHFHHGLHDDADVWSRHCMEFCEERAIPFSLRKLEIATTTTSNIEEVARNCRYKAIVDILGQDEMYLTAHHSDDQAETVFLNLMRGSGFEGLSGIPELRRLGSGWVARPLLNWSRSDLETYLERHQVKWMTDPGNQDPAYDRSYLRNQLFPLIEKRWPGLSKRLNRSARIARVTAEALAEFVNSAAGNLLHSTSRMPLPPLLELAPTIQALVLRQWLRLQEILAPPESRLLEFLSQLATATPSSNAEVCWGDWRIKHYRGELWLEDLTTSTTCQKIDWVSDPLLELGSGLGRLQLNGDPAGIPPGWQVDSRRKGQRIHIAEHASRRTLKDCFRQSGIPPWLRDSIPVLYWNDEAVAIGDWLLADKLRKWLESNRLNYTWHPKDPLLMDIRETNLSDS